MLRRNIFSRPPLSAEGMLYGIPSPRPRLSSKSGMKSGKKKTTANERIQRTRTSGAE
jgi:hypothetical protein